MARRRYRFNPKLHPDDLRHAVGMLVEGLEAERDGLWMPDGVTQSMLAVLQLMLQEREKPKS